MALLRRPRPAAPFDHLDDVQGAIRELYARLSGPVVKAFGTLALPDAGPLTEAAAAMTRHLGIGDVRVVVGFGPLGGHVGEVELAPGPEYVVTLSPHYRDDPRDAPAVLAHEVTHVFLHRHGIRHADLARNEILTDTAALYLGLGHPMLAAYRVDVVQGTYTRRRTTSRVGYLTPPEMGYVLAKRALAFGEEPARFTGAAAEASELGRRRALEDYTRPPYRLEDGTVACPACGHDTRAPRTVTARCATCGSTFVP